MANNNHFELTLDTLAPAGSISGLGEFEKENKPLVIDGGDAAFKKVWFDALNANDVKNVMAIKRLNGKQKTLKLSLCLLQLASTTIT